MAKTREQARPKRQPKQPDKYEPAKQGRQMGLQQQITMHAAVETACHQDRKQSRCIMQ